MFDGLMGGKFSKKCKQCVKNISNRIVLIRRKRQATVRLLKKDVADLLAGGHDADAYGRMDALIVDMNRASCYDMIEQFCQCVLNQLPVLRKQRECSEEAKEAVATLIFAAARFSDLPELYDLRQAFTERYGSQIEIYVNSEVVEKMQKKSFSEDKKLKLMKSIAEEFSVNWDSKVFKEKMDRPSTPSVQANRSINNERHSRAQANSRNVIDQPKEAAPAAAGPANSRKQPSYDAEAAIGGRKEITINSSDRKEVVINDNIKTNEMKQSSRRNEADYMAGSIQDVPSKGRWRAPHKSFMQKQQLQPEPRDIHVVSSIPNRPLHDPTGRTMKLFSAAEEAVNVKPIYDDYLEDRPHFKPKGFQNGIDKDLIKPKVSANRINKYDLENKETVRSKSPMAHGPSLVGLDRNSQEPAICRGVKTVNMIPPGSLSEGVKSRGNVASEMPKAEELDPSPVHERKPNVPMRSKDVRPMCMIPPPYTIKSKNSPINAEEVKVHDEPVKNSNFADFERSNGGEKAMPISVRRRLPKSPSVETNHASSDAKPISPSPLACRKGEGYVDVGLYDRGTVNRNQRKVAEEFAAAVVNHDRHAHEHSSSIRKHGGQRSAATYDAERDEEEVAMDRLLVHYSKKIVNADYGRRRARTRASAEPEVDAERIHPNHRGNGRIPPSAPERVASFPSKPASRVVEVGISGGSTRAPSMCPDMLRANGGCMQPGMSNHDDLAARFLALKYS